MSIPILRFATSTALIASLAALPVAADEPPPAQNGPSVATKARSKTCVVTGKTPVAADTMIHDAQTGGQAIGKLTGAEVPLTLSHFPANMKGRAHVTTTTGNGAVRIEGWIDVSKLRLFSNRDLPLVGGQIWLTGGQELELTDASTSAFTARHEILGSQNQVVEAQVPCSAIQLELPTMKAQTSPKRARTYQMRNDSIELYDGPRGDRVFELKMAEGARKVFWSTEARSGFLHVVSRGDVTIDAWARIRDLSYLRHAELFDLESIQPKPLKERKLALQDPPEVVTATTEMPIHRKPENSLERIGLVEVGARFYPMEQSGEWTNIMPEDLAVLPPDDGGFWVRTSGLPKK